MKKYKLTIFILLFFVSPILSASICDSGSQYLKQGNFQRAYNTFNYLSKLKHGCAEYYLSIMYQNGYYVKQNNKKAAEYLKHSEKNGFVPTARMEEELLD